MHVFGLQGHYRYCEALFSLGEGQKAIEANTMAQSLCKEDREGVKDLEQQHLKFIEMPDPKGTFTAAPSITFYVLSIKNIYSKPLKPHS